MATMAELINQGVLNMQQGGQQAPPSPPVYQPPQILNPAGQQAPTMSMPQVATVQGGAPSIPANVLMPLVQQAMEAAQQQSQTQDPLLLAMQQRLLAHTYNKDPRSAMIDAYIKMNQANPGKGPITNLVNPIVNALLARRMAPQLLQNQQDAADLQRMKVMAAMGQYQANMSKANKGITGPLGVLSELVKSHVLQGSPEQTSMAIANQKGLQSAYNTGFTQTSETNRAKMIQDRLDNREAYVQSNENKRKVQEINAAMDRVKLEGKQAMERVDKQQGGEMARLQFKTGVEQDNKDREYELKVLDAAKNWTHLDNVDMNAAANFQVAFENMKTSKERLGLEKVNTDVAVKNMLRMGDAQQREQLYQQANTVMTYAQTQPPAVRDQIIRDQLGPFISGITNQPFEVQDPLKAGYAWMNALRTTFQGTGLFNKPNYGIVQPAGAPDTSSAPRTTGPAWLQPPQPQPVQMPNISPTRPTTGLPQLPPELANLPGMQQFVQPGGAAPPAPIPQVTIPPLPTTVAPPTAPPTPTPTPSSSPLADYGATGVANDYFNALKARMAPPTIPVIPAE